MGTQGTAFKLLCDPEGNVFGVEAGEEQYIQGCKPGEVFATAESLQVGLPDFGSFKLTVPALKISEVTTTDVKLMRCCWRMILGRWQCVPC